MIKTITLENFRGLSGTFPVSKLTRLRGPNGAGKSSFKEAVSFAFSGRDSIGTPSPAHLITTGEGALKVEIATDKAIILRTLTAKKSSTLKLTVGGVSTVLTQAEFETKVGSPELFLSIFVPGYFFKLLPNLRQKVLQEVLPKIDRYQLLTELLSLKEVPQFVRALDLTKRADLVQAGVANDRRAIQRQLDQGQGALTVFYSHTDPGPAPVEPQAVSQLPRMEALKREWSVSQTAYQNHQQRMNDWERQRLQGERAESNIARVTAELGGLQLLPLPPDPIELRTERDKLLASLRADPAPPPKSFSVDGDTCGTCGQTVAVKHRERVTQRNAEAFTEFERVRNEINAWNAEIRGQLAKVDAAFREHTRQRSDAESVNRDCALRRAKLETQLQALQSFQLPPAPEEPTAPTEPYSLEEDMHVRQAVTAYQRAIGEHAHKLSQFHAAQGEIARRATEFDQLTATINTCHMLEEALGRLPHAELERQTSALEMEGFYLTLGGAVIDLYDHRGLPRDLLSEGERMKADIVFAEKLNSLSHTKPSLFFIDNVDLVDTLALPPYAQCFTAHVDRTLQGLVVEGD